MYDTFVLLVLSDSRDAGGGGDGGGGGGEVSSTTTTTTTLPHLAPHRGCRLQVRWRRTGHPLRDLRRLIAQGATFRSSRLYALGGHSDILSSICALACVGGMAHWAPQR